MKGFALLTTLLLSLPIFGPVLMAGSSEAETWGDPRLSSSYQLNETIFLDEIPFSIGGQKASAKGTVVFPSGKTSESSKVVLSESGLYSVRYSAYLDSKVYEKEETFFVSTPYFRHGSKSSAHYGIGERATHDGLVVSLAKNEVLSFNEIIDLTTLTKNDCLFRFYMTPSAMGAHDVGSLIFTLTDVEDETNYLEITAQRHMWKPSTNQGKADIFGKGDDTDRVSAESWNADGTIASGGGGAKDYVVANSIYGAIVDFTFNGVRRVISKQNYGWRDEAHTDWGWISNDYTNISTADYDATECLVTYDYDSMELGAINMKLDFKGCRTDETNYVKVWDFDDERLADKVQGGNGIWRGFKSGKVRLSVRGDQYEGGYANFVLTNVHGLDFRQTVLEDKEAPEIEVAASLGEDGFASLVGVAGLSYPIPQASAKDAYCGETPVEAVVYENYGTPFQVNVDTLNGRFYPKRAGDYAIVYSSQDHNGNRAAKTVMVHVDASSSPIGVCFPDGITKSGKQGHRYRLPDYRLESTRGEGSASAIAFFGEESIGIEDWSFVPEKPGDYTVSMIFEDEVGQTKTYSYSLHVEAEERPFLLDEPILPRNYIAHGEYAVPEVGAYRYNNGVKEPIEPEVTVSYSEMADGVPTEKETKLSSGGAFSTKNAADGSMVRLRYAYEGATLGEYEVPLINPIYWDEENSADAVDFKKYFITDEEDALSFDLEGDGLGGYRFSPKDEQMDVSFANPLLADEFSMGFALKKGTEFGSIEIRLSDESSPKESVSIRLVMNSSGSIGLEANGVSKPLAGLSTKEDNVSLSVAFDGKSVRVGDKAAIALDSFDSGKAFDGFKTHKVWLDFSFRGFAEGGCVNLKNIGNHYFEAFQDFYDNPIEPYMDFVPPQYVSLGNHGKYGIVGETVETDAVIAQDVFAPTSSVRVTMLQDDGAPLIDSSGAAIENRDASSPLSIRLSEPSVYTASYSVAEKAGEKGWVASNSKRFEYYYGALDDRKPVIVLTSTMKSSAYVGDALSLPTFYVKDDVSEVENLTVMREMILPTGRLQMIPEGIDGYRFNEAGEYEFRIVVLDEVGNVSIYSAFVEIKERGQ